MARPPETDTATAFLQALFALEDRLRALPPDRHHPAIDLAVARLRRHRRRPQALPRPLVTPDDQLDLEEMLAALRRRA